MNWARLEEEAGILELEEDDAIAEFEEETATAELEEATDSEGAELDELRHVPHDASMTPATSETRIMMLVFIEESFFFAALL